MKIRELEKVFADDFGSPIFPMLADYYYNENQLERAKKVCNIGLKNSPDNILGDFILGKIFLKEEKIIEAEKKLKRVVSQSKNIKALLILIDVLINLKRSKSTIKKYIFMLDRLVPGHNQVKSYKKKYLSKKSHKNVKKNKIISKNNLRVTIDAKLATQTMYNLLLKQKKYNHALEVLNIMSSNKKNAQFVVKNKTIVLQRIKKRNQ